MMMLEALAGPSRLICRRTISPVCFHRRCQSTSSSKIRAAPFLLPPSSAAHKLHMNGLIATAKFSNLIYAGLLKLFGPSISPIAKELGLGDGLSMQDLKAVYWPVWRFDALFEGTVEGKGKERSEGKGWVTIREGYVPGNSFAPLSYLSFAVPPLPDDLPEFNAGSLKQLGDGYDIVTVPFSVSPFAFMDKVRRLIGRRGKFEDLPIDESQWKEVMTAAYPLYFPVYIAEFEQKREEGDRRFTVVMDAHDANITNCRASWPPPAEIYDTGRFTTNYFINPAPYLPIAEMILPMVRPASAGPPMSPRTVNDLYSSWLSPAPSSSRSIPPSPLVDITEPVPWDDIRIQSWSGSEREQNIDYAEQCASTWKSIGALEGIAQLKTQLKDGADPQGFVMSVGDGGAPKMEPKPMSEIAKQMGEDVERMKAELLGAKPPWLIDWEEMEKKREL